MRREWAEKASGIGGGARFAACLLLVATCGWAAGGDRGHKSGGTVSRAYLDAKGLFEKVWEPGRASEHGGDGLGPLYNADSCVACHHQGGVGGGGADEHNVTLLTVGAGAAGIAEPEQTAQGEPEDIHPGLKSHASVVIHGQATSQSDRARLTKLRSLRAIQTRDELLAARTTERSTPALFGAGLIDAIPNEALIAAARRKSPAFPEVKGRVSRLKDGRLGRFGWKGQTASLRDFVLAACSNELGLEVPGRHQVSLASAKEFDPAKLKLDLDAGQCDLLVAFVRELPRPVFRPIDPLGPYRGRAVFEAIGCAACHAPQLGGVDGLYSDLLLHDLGDRFRDAGSGYGPASPGRVIERAKSKADDEGRPPSGEAAPTEWRTAPLWGVASSPPYLHDGRARTLDEAIRLHGGEAAETALRYARLSRDDGQALLSLLHSLRASPRAALRIDPAKLRGRSWVAPRAVEGPAASPSPSGICCRFG